MTAVITGADELKALAGQRIGLSRWVHVGQRDVDAFAAITNDEQWIHVDPERAKAGPFGGTIMHGFFTLALATSLLWDVVQVDGFDVVINYGVNKVRFPAPLRVGTHFFAAVDLAEVRTVKGGVEAVWRLTFETAAAEKPACIAEIVFRYYGAQ